MAFGMKTKIPFNADAGRFYVYAVWGIRNSGDAPELIALATTENAQKRYLKLGRTAGFFRVRSELAWLDHMYGESIMGKVLRMGNKEIALKLDTNACLARALTKPQRTLLRVAKKNGYVSAERQRRRMCERLAAIGLLSKSGLVAYALTERGAQVLSIKA